MSQERRQFSRATQAIETPSRLAGSLGASWMSVTTVNISAAGVRLRGPEPLDAGELLELRLQIPGTGKPVEVQGRVVWSKMQASGVTELGIEFMEIDDQQQRHIDQLVEFLGKSSGGPPPSS